MTTATEPTAREESEFVTWARSELQRAGLFDSDSDYEGMLGESIMEMVLTFDAAGHSGFSAAWAASIFQRLSERKPLSPLTDDRDEWMHIAEERWVGGQDTWQSRREPSCFSHDGGATYYDLDEPLKGWRAAWQRLNGSRLPLGRYRPKFHATEPADTPEAT